MDDGGPHGSFNSGIAHKVKLYVRASTRTHSRSVHTEKKTYDRLGHESDGARARVCVCTLSDRHYTQTHIHQSDEMLCERSLARGGTLSALIYLSVCVCGGISDVELELWVMSETRRCDARPERFL